VNAQSTIVTPEGEVVNAESIEAQQARVRLWERIGTLIVVAVGQVMDMITGVLPGYDLGAKADVLQFSAEHCAALLESAGEPVDSKAVFAAYDVSMQLLDTIPLIPHTWVEYYARDEKWWEEHPRWDLGEPKRQIGKPDFERIRSLRQKHKLVFDYPYEFQPKYKITDPPAIEASQITEKKES
jgi:hypothetical protein